MAVKNLYMRCLATAGRTKIARLKDRELPLLQQLDFYLRVIGERVVDLNEIVREYEQAQQKPIQRVASEKESKEKESKEKDSKKE
jgi:hypothetical protein